MPTTDLTESFTPQQRIVIDDMIEQWIGKMCDNLSLINQNKTSKCLTLQEITWTDMIVDMTCEHINRMAKIVKAMDKRPKKTYSPEMPDVFMPYVAQGMLEDMIHNLEKLPNPNELLGEIIKGLQEQV